MLIGGEERNIRQCILLAHYVSDIIVLNAPQCASSSQYKEVGIDASSQGSSVPSITCVLVLAVARAGDGTVTRRVVVTLISQSRASPRRSYFDVYHPRLAHSTIVVKEGHVC